MKDSHILLLPYLKISLETLSRWDKLYLQWDKVQVWREPQTLQSMKKKKIQFLACNYMAMIWRKFCFGENITKTFSYMRFSSFLKLCILSCKQVSSSSRFSAKVLILEVLNTWNLVSGRELQGWGIVVFWKDVLLVAFVQYILPVLTKSLEIP